jgi:hypothetical protein
MNTIKNIDIKEEAILLYLVKNNNDPTHATAFEKKLPQSGITIMMPNGNVPVTITRRWARIVCERLVKEGVIWFEMHKVWRQKEPVKHYKIVENLETLKKVAAKVLSLFGGILIRTVFVQKIIENELIPELEKTYDTSFDDETKVSILSVLLLSTKALELALAHPVLPEIRAKTKSERIEQVNKALLGIFVAALITDLSQTGLRWRAELLDRIKIDMHATIKIGKAEATIEAGLDFVSDLKNQVIDYLRESSPRTLQNDIYYNKGGKTEDQGTTVIQNGDNQGRH